MKKQNKITADQVLIITSSLCDMSLSQQYNFLRKKFGANLFSLSHMKAKKDYPEIRRNKKYKKTVNMSVFCDVLDLIFRVKLSAHRTGGKRRCAALVQSVSLNFRLQSFQHKKEKAIKNRICSCLRTQHINLFFDCKENEVDVHHGGPDWSYYRGRNHAYVKVTSTFYFKKSRSEIFRLIDLICDAGTFVMPERIFESGSVVSIIGKSVTNSRGYSLKYSTNKKHYVSKVDEFIFSSITSLSDSIDKVRTKALVQKNLLSLTNKSIFLCRNVIVKFADALDSGNCGSGINAFIRRHNLNSKGVKFSKLYFLNKSINNADLTKTLEYVTSPHFCVVK